MGQNGRPHLLFWLQLLVLVEEKVRLIGLDNFPGDLINNFVVKLEPVHTPAHESIVVARMDARSGMDNDGAEIIHRCAATVSKFSQIKCVAKGNVSTNFDAVCCAEAIELDHEKRRLRKSPTAYGDGEL